MTPADVRLQRWCEYVASVFHEAERQGGAAYPDRDASLVECVVRVLTTPHAQDTDWILACIAEHRQVDWLKGEYP